MFIALVTVASTKGQQLPTAPASFDVASIRPSRQEAEQHSNVPLDSGNVYASVSAEDARTTAGGLLVATHQPLWRYISFAYSLSGTQELAFRFSMFSGAPKSGAPRWVTGTFAGGADYFDISARAPAETSIDQMRVMMQTLLADRFQLRTAWVTADTPVFALALAKPGVTGPKLRSHTAADICEGSASAASPQIRPHTGTLLSSDDLPSLCGVIARVPSAGVGQRYGGRAVPLSLLATSIPTMTGLAVVSRPVVDQTGLIGLYDFSLTWQHDVVGGDAAVSENAANFHEALKLQLGLELKSAHAPIRFLTITSVERPADN
ncbi:MAG: TIGR03435 family protein [Janthinobacterium lividum]